MVLLIQGLGILLTLHTRRIMLSIIRVIPDLLIPLLPTFTHQKLIVCHMVPKPPTVAVLKNAAAVMRVIPIHAVAGIAKFLQSRNKASAIEAGKKRAIAAGEFGKSSNVEMWSSIRSSCIIASDGTRADNRARAAKMTMKNVARDVEGNMMACRGVHEDMMTPENE